MAGNHPRIATGRFEESAAFLLSDLSTDSASLLVDCTQNRLRKHEEPVVGLEVGFDPRDYDLARLGASLPRKRIVEEAAVGLALLFLPHLADGEITNVTKDGERADYWVDGRRCLLEVSGTEDPRRLKSRHRAKVEQNIRNASGLPCFVSVSCFGNLESLFSFHEDHR
jgi:hypothetical protein